MILCSVTESNKSHFLKFLIEKKELRLLSPYGEGAFSLFMRIICLGDDEYKSVLKRRWMEVHEGALSVESG